MRESSKNTPNLKFDFVFPLQSSFRGHVMAGNPWADVVDIDDDDFSDEMEDEENSGGHEEDNATYPANAKREPFRSLANNHHQSSRLPLSTLQHGNVPGSAASSSSVLGLRKPLSNNAQAKARSRPLTSANAIAKASTEGTIPGAGD